ncbi:MAG: biliverdin-producing heme oxygenase [Haliscomenobacter sp.]|uniref:biliverdin-producing heme oxygenase n=1 Tax=Haliscomenobacter sp. TaxID=2717303 RepID=UPI0029B60414|nr:biliverdin-producing heme oxygenase [Haliscomenobacter sp.]MDX2071682.1 biliverdin-producing heme oxygenase [Haliscomenobacter sp.]
MESAIFLQRLRSKTANSHQLIEQNSASQLLISEEVTIVQYAYYLKSLYGFVHGFEKMVFPILKHNPLLQLNERSKSHFIQADLAMLNQTAAQPYVSDELFSTHYPTAAAAFGGMYVLEGSTLGGQIISKHLSKVLGTAVTGKTTYLSAYASQTSTMWKSFLQLLCEAAASNNNEDEIIESAVNTFALLNNCLSDYSYQLAENEN